MQVFTNLNKKFGRFKDTLLRMRYRPSIKVKVHLYSGIELKLKNMTTHKKSEPHCQLYIPMTNVIIMNLGKIYANPIFNVSRFCF